MMEKGTRERTISLETLQHYLQQAEKLVLGLTSEERIELLRNPLLSLPNSVSPFHRAAHEAMCAGSEKNEEASRENKIMAALLRSELQRQSLLSAIPLEVADKIGYFSDMETIKQLSQAYPDCSNFFKPRLDAKELLLSVFDADLEGKATQLISSITPENGNIVLERVYGKERCSRIWQAVSALEFAAWTGDVTLMNALLTKVPAHKKGEALKQLTGVRVNGLEHGKHMAPFHLFIEKCRIFDRDFYQFKDWEARDEYCLKIIGGAEKLLSLFGLQWLCDDEPFDPIPRFDRAPSRAPLLEGKSLLSVLASLAENFFIYKWWGPRTDPGFSALELRGALIADPRVLQLSGCALESLCQVSLDALDNTILQLQQKIAATLTNSNS